MNEKFGFGKTILGTVKGLVSPKEYVNTSKKSSWVSVNIFIIIVSIILPLAVFFIPVTMTFGNGKLADIIDEEVAYFCIDKNGFSCEKKYEWKSTAEYYISVDTSDGYVEDDEMEELLAEGRYSTMVIATANEIIFYSDEDITTVKWSSIYTDLQNITERDVYDKTFLTDSIRKYDTPVLIAIYIIIVLLFIIIYYIAGILWGLVGRLIRLLFKVEREIDNSDLMKMVLLIRTPWFVIVVLLVGLVLKGSALTSFLLGALIELNYLILALYSLKNKTN